MWEAVKPIVALSAADAYIFSRTSLRCPAVDTSIHHLTRERKFAVWYYEHMTEFAQGGRMDPVRLRLLAPEWQMLPVAPNQGLFLTLYGRLLTFDETITRVVNIVFAYGEQVARGEAELYDVEYLGMALAVVAGHNRVQLLALSGFNRVKLAKQLRQKSGRTHDFKPVLDLALSILDELLYTEEQRRAEGWAATLDADTARLNAWLRVCDQAGYGLTLNAAVGR